MNSLQLISPCSGPFLPQVIDLMIRQDSQGGNLDLSQTMIVFPNRYARERFRILLQKETKKRGIDSYKEPRLLEIGQLPERLYHPRYPLISSWPELLIWHKLLSGKLPPEFFPGGDTGFRARLELADRIRQLRQEVASEEYDFAKIAQFVREQSREDKQWEALANLEQSYLRLLDEYHYGDQVTERRMALTENRCGTRYSRVYLIGLSELGRPTREMLLRIQKKITSFAYAEESDREKYDAFGCVLFEKWDNVTFPLRDHQILQKTTPFDEADTAALIAAKEIPEPGKNLSIALLDPEISSSLEYQLNSKDLPFLPRPKNTASHNRVVRLLNSIARFIERREYEPFADLLRHPDLEKYIQTRYPEQTQKYDSLTPLDLHQTYFVPERIGRNFGVREEEPGEDEDRGQTIRRENRTFLRLICRDLDQLFAPFYGLDAQKSEEPLNENNENGPEAIGAITAQMESVREVFQSRTIADWGVILLNLLGQIYGKTLPSKEELLQELSDTASKETSPFEGEPITEEVTPENDRDGQITTGLRLTTEFVKKILELPSELSSSISGIEFLGLFRRFCYETALVQTSDEGKIPLLGWLDLLFDERPNLIIVGMNDEYFPTRPASKLFLSENLRDQLHLENNRKRAIRDAARFHSLVLSHPNLKILFARRSLGDDYLRPSRFLLMASSVEDSARRTILYCSPQVSSEESSPKIEETLPSRKSQFRPLVFHPRDPAPTHFTPSLFKSFLISPYRWFLQNGLRLQESSDNAVELGRDKFGSLIHKALEVFGKTPGIRDSVDAEEIEQFFDRWIETQIQWYRSFHSSGVLLLQLEQVRHRLHLFAQWQSQWRRAGNQILFAEKNSEGRWERVIDGEKVTVTGQIDRIDYNEEHHLFFVFDYKTFDNVQIKKITVDESTPIQKLLNTQKGNAIEDQYWTYLPYPPRYSEEEEEPNERGRWRHWKDLQLILYRPLAQKILQNNDYPVQKEDISCCYLFLPKIDSVIAAKGVWSEDDFENGYLAFDWIVRTIRRHWRNGIDPNALIDPDTPERGTLLPERVPIYNDPFSIITMK